MTFSVGRIDFINTAPVYYGIDTGEVACPGRTVKGPPAVLNRMLKRSEIQISAVSSVAFAEAFPDWLILPSLSISACGPVQSVLLCLRRPLEEISRPLVGLSDKSATSKALTRILLEDFNELEPVYKDVDLSTGIPEGLDGLLVIGDDALRLPFKGVYPFAIDLGEFWVEHTGLPFVFGLWTVRRDFAKSRPLETAAVARALQTSCESGKRNLDGAARLAAERTQVAEEKCRAYLEYIEYDLGERQIAGLERFFSLLKKRGELDERVKPLFWSNEA